MSMSLQERIAAKKKAIDAKSGQIDRPVKLGSGANKIRILPNWAGDLNADFFQDFGQHFIKDAAGNVKAVYVCTANTFGTECPICQLRADLGVTTTDESKLMILQEAKPSNRVVVNAIIRGKDNDKPQLLELPPTTFGDYLEIAGAWINEHEINILDLASGHDVTITKTGAGRDTSYTVVASPKPTAVDPSVLSSCKDLRAYADQQYEAGLQKALTALRFNAGGTAPALGAPSARPALSAPAEDDGLMTVDPSVLEHESAAAEAAAPSKPAPAPATELSEENAAELDSILADLDRESVAA